MFKTFWAAKITLVNQTTIPASLHGYGMAAVNNDNASVILYGELIANFGAAYAATQESVKTQGSTIASMQGQMQDIQQYCMVLHQQPPPLSTCGSSNSAAAVVRLVAPQPGGGGYPAPPGGFPGSQRPLQPPTPFKRFENQNYCHTHGRDVDNAHTSTTCQKPGPAHNHSATRTNTMGGLMAGLHKTILPSASRRIPPAPRQQCTPAPMMWQQPPPPMNFTPMMTAMHPMMPTTPYHTINHMGPQFGPPPLQFGPPPLPSHCLHPIPHRLQE
jgi:hypothetical protein